MSFYKNIGVEIKEYTIEKGKRINPQIGEIFRLSDSSEFYKCLPKSIHGCIGCCFFPRCIPKGNIGIDCYNKCFKVEDL